MTNEQIEAERLAFREWYSAATLPSELLRRTEAAWLARAELDPTNQPQVGNGGLAAIIGKWPGDETDEEINQALAEMKGKRCPECERIMANERSASESEP